MKLNIAVANAFSKVWTWWNPAWIVLWANGLSNEVMQRIANQINLTETVFVMKPSGNADIRLKYFTPFKEIDMAWHPTVATMYYLADKGIVTKESISLETNLWISSLLVDFSNDIEITMEHNVPVFWNQIIDIDRLARVLWILPEDIMSTWLIPQMVSTGLPEIIVPISSLAALENVKRNIDELKKICVENGADELQAYALDSYDKKYKIHTRNICPREWVEDSACWMGNSALSSYLVKNKVFQLSDNSLVIDVEQWRSVGRDCAIRSIINANNDGEIMKAQISWTAVTISEWVFYL